MKKRTKIIIAVLSVVPIICIAVGSICLFSFRESIAMSALYANSSQILGDIEENQNESTENAEKLYDAILANESITAKEKKTLANYIQYFVDNKYIDCEYVCNKLATFTITPNDPALLDDGISAEYKSENSITFANDEEREFSLSHELHHCIESENLSYDYYGWFGEGFTCLVNYEYFDVVADSCNTQTFFVRGLCEIVGPEFLFELSATGDISVLENALVERGIDEIAIAEAFALFTQLKDDESYMGVLTDEQRFEAVFVLLDMYNVAYDYPENITYSFYKAVEEFVGVNSEEYCYYYLNSTKREESDWNEQYVPQTTLDTLYEDLIDCAS